MHTTKIDLPESKRTALVKLLNDRLADVVDLRLQAKQAHWNVKGPSFIALHKLFDEVAEIADELADLMAERAVILGGIAEGTLGQVAEKTTLAPYPLQIASGREHVDALSSALAATGKTVRSAIDQATELGDADTADLFTEASRALDKSLWFVEAHIQAGQ